MYERKKKSENGNRSSRVRSAVKKTDCCFIGCRAFPEALSGEKRYISPEKNSKGDAEQVLFADCSLMKLSANSNGISIKVFAPNGSYGFKRGVL